MDAETVQFLETSAVEFQALEAWGDEPDVNEGDIGELTSPLSGDADSTAEGHEEIAHFLAAVEAFVGVVPDALHGVVALRFGEDIFELDLQVVVDVVGITVNKINLGHCVCL